VKIGVIGDDFTGSSDIALTLAQAGMRTVQYVRVPDTTAQEDVQAGVVSLKSRSCPVDDAIADSLAALTWLREQGCELFIFKYCSTFDSTKSGNIGPVIDALVDALGCSTPVIVCPAFPATGRTIYQGHLYVFDRLLSESGMQNHPITPMTDPDLRRWLQHQTPHGVGHLPLNTLRDGKAREHMMSELAAGRQRIVCDIAIGVPALFGIEATQHSDWKGQEGYSLALSGSCSSTTLLQIAHHCEHGGAYMALSIPDILDGTVTAQGIVDWAKLQSGLPLISTSNAPDTVKQIQATHGAQITATAIEKFFGKVASLACEQGITRLISAGGETSGAVVQSLNIEAMEIGPMIDPGVPALRVSGRNLNIALKSGNFGAENFFSKANQMLSGQI